MKRSLYVLLTVIFFISTSTTTLAVDSVPVQPNYVGVSSIAPLVRTKMNNVVLCSDRVTCKVGYTARVVWNFQYQNNRRWITVKSWSNSGSSLLLNETVSVVSGKTYRLQTVATVYNSAGKQVETVTGTSKSVKI